MTTEASAVEPLKPQIGVLAYGSLIDDPGPEIGPAIVRTIADVTTPFSVEFARASSTRGGGPTLVPVTEGGASVKAVVHLLKPDVTFGQAKDWVWRREVRKFGVDEHYDESATGKNRVHIEVLEDFQGISNVLYTRIGANISPLNADELARRAIASAQSPKVAEGEDGISYLARAIVQGIATPLTADYHQAILQRTQATTLAAAIELSRAVRNVRANSAPATLSTSI